MTVRGYPIEGRREDLENLDVDLQSKFATFTQAGVNKYALDTFPMGVAEVTASVAAEAGSNASRIVVTAHSMRKGDVLQFISTTNPLLETWTQVLRVEDANTVILTGALSADISTGDTFTVLRPVFTKLASDGASLSTVITGPIRIQRGASGVYSATEITKDTAVSGNTIPLPVEIVSAAGTEINITAGDLNVQLSATGVNYDSTRLGDGTNELGINASNEALVKDTDVETAVVAVGAQLPATLGQKAKATSLAVTLATDEDPLTVGDITGTISLPTGAATSANQTSTITAINAVETDVEAGNVLLTAINAKDFATQTTLAAINTKTPSLGQSNEAGSVPVSLTTAQASNLADVDTAVTALAAEITANGVKVVVHDLATVATEVTLAAIAADIAVIEADTALIKAALQAQEAALAVSSFTRVDFSVTNVTDLADVSIIGSTPSAFKAARFFYAGGQPIYLKVGGVNEMIIPPGADFEIRLDIAASSAIALRAVVASTTIQTGQLIINWLG